jgi:hypothetical protein
LFFFVFLAASSSFSARASLRLGVEKARSRSLARDE